MITLHDAGIWLALGQVSVEHSIPTGQKCIGLVDVASAFWVMHYSFVGLEAFSKLPMMRPMLREHWYLLAESGQTGPASGITF